MAYISTYADKVEYDATHSAETVWIVLTKKGEMVAFESQKDAEVYGKTQGNYTPVLAVFVSRILVT